MLDEFNISAQELGKAADAQEITRLYGEFLDSFASSLLEVENSSHSPLIQGRLVKGLEDILFEAAIEMLDDMSKAKPDDLDGISARYNAAYKLLSVRVGDQRTDMTDAQTQKLWHTSGMVSRHFRALSLPQFGRDRNTRDQYVRIADQAKQIIPSLKDLQKPK